MAMTDRHAARERGNVLLFALLVMTTVIVGSVGIGSLILSSLQQTKTIDSSVIAYYAAEAGVEHALFVARTRGVLPASVATPEPLGNGASWTRTVSGNEDVIYLTVKEDTVAEVALYDPDAATAATAIASVGISWDDGCSGCSVLQATLVGWDPGGPISWDPNAQTYNYAGGSAAISLGSPAKLYKLRLLARNADLDHVAVRAYDDAASQIPIPGRVRVEATGEFIDVRQLLVATMPRRIPLSGIFNFVVFSECSLVKGGPISCP